MSNSTKLDGTFIVFEGPDYSGKSSQALNLYNYLSNAGLPVKQVQDPYKKGVCGLIKELIMNYPEVSQNTQALLFGAARAELMSNKIIPSLRAGEIVICDRLDLSTRVYQGMEGVDPDFIEDMSMFTNNLIPGGYYEDNQVYPDMTILLDVSPETAKKRREARGVENHFDDRGDDYFNDIRSKYLREYHRLPYDRRMMVDHLMTSMPRKDVNDHIVDELKTRGVI